MENVIFYSMYGVRGDVIVFVDDQGIKIELLISDNNIWVYPTEKYTIEELRELGSVEEYII